MSAGPIWIRVTKHAVKRWRERFGDPKATWRDVRRIVNECRPLSFDEKRDLVDVLREQRRGKKKMMVVLTDTIAFHESHLAVFFGTHTTEPNGKRIWVVRTVISLAAASKSAI